MILKNVVIVLAVLFAIAGGIGTFYFYSKCNDALAEKKVYTQQNSQLQASLDAIGTMTEVLTVRKNVEAGDFIQEDDLVVQSIPQSSVTESFILSKTDVVGKLWKIDITPGTSITSDLILEEPITQTSYERDLSFAYLPLGLRVGDYVDIQITLPYGEEYSVISHKRVQQMVAETNTIKVILNAEEMALWTSAMKDYALYNTKGLQLYLVKYVEPGISTAAIPSYPVRKEMEEVVASNVNIKDVTRCVNSVLRDEIEIRLGKVTDNDASALYTGTTVEASKIQQSSYDYVESQPTQGTTQGTLQDSVNQAYDYIMNTDPVEDIYLPVQNEQTSITDTQVNAAEGNNPYTGAEKELN